MIHVQGLNVTCWSIVGQMERVFKHLKAVKNQLQDALEEGEYEDLDACLLPKLSHHISALLPTPFSDNEYSSDKDDEVTATFQNVTLRNGWMVTSTEYEDSSAPATTKKGPKTKKKKAVVTWEKRSVRDCFDDLHSSAQLLRSSLNAKFNEAITPTQKQLSIFF